MKLFSTNTLPVQAATGHVSQGLENPAYTQQAERIWSVARSYYDTGISPMIGLSVRYQGETVLERNLGYIDKSLSTPVTLSTPVCLYSVSKMITALLIHKLVELGQLKLSDKVKYYLPRYSGKGKDSTSISELLLHQGGIPLIKPKGSDKLDPEILFDIDAIMTTLYEAPLVAAEKKDTAYHAITAGYLLGKILTTVSDQSLNELLDIHFVQPMGLTLLGYGLDESLIPVVAKQVATGLHPKLGSDWYVTNILSGGLQTAVDFTNDKRFYQGFCPSGNVHADLYSITSVMQMLLDGGTYNGQQILQPVSINRIRRPSTGWRFDKTLLVPMRYGEGTMSGGRPIGLFGQFSSNSFGHLGFTNILCYADPKRDLSVAFLNTGKAVLGPHIPDLARLVWTINNAF